MHADAFQTAVELTPADLMAAKSSQIEWSEPWNEIKNKISLCHGFRLEDDVWVFPETQISRNLAKRKIDFTRIEPAPKNPDLIGLKRRVKRMVWLYLHDQSTIALTPGTKQIYSHCFISMVNILSQKKVHIPNANDGCPDGNPLFAAINESDFDLWVPVTKQMRNGISLVHVVFEDTQDGFCFSPQSYTQHIQAKKCRTNEHKGLNTKAVVFGALEDHDLSQLLHLCMTYIGYFEIAEALWEWREDHRERLDRTGEATELFSIRKRNGKYAFKHGSQCSKIIAADFEAKVMAPNHQAWAKKGLIDSQGCFIAPILGQSNTLYTKPFDFRYEQALLTFVRSIRTAALIYVLFLTGMRVQEAFALKEDLYVPTQQDFDLIKGRVFKNTGSIHGELRDWSYPKIASPVLEVAKRSKALHETIAATNSDDKLFLKNAGEVRQIGKLLKEQYRCEGALNSLLKRLRPSSISLVVRTGRDLLAVKIQAGHDLIEQTSAYAQSNPNHSYIEALEAEHRKVDHQFGYNILKALTNFKGHRAQNDLLVGNTVEFLIKIDAVSEEDKRRRARLQSAIDTANTSDFLEVLRDLGDTLDDVAVFLGEGVRRNGHGRYCMAKRGGANFKGACSKVSGKLDDTSCVPWCQYNFEDWIGLDKRAEDTERLLKRFEQQFDGKVALFRNQFVNLLNEVLKTVWSFSGPLKRYKTDIRIANMVEQVRAYDETFLAYLDPYARRTLKEYENA